jgi:hypothetical protein
MVLTQTVCENCDRLKDDSYKYCPSCGEQSPWVEEAVYEFDKEDLPIFFTCNFHDDYYMLWDEFCQEYFGANLSKEDIKNLPQDFPRMKYSDSKSYYVLAEDLEIRGPFNTKEEAREEV